MLSRSASYDGTLILPDYTDRNCVAFDPKKIQGMCSGHLRQEFRELELLDHITTLMYEGVLPSTVYGDRRYNLIETFQTVYGPLYVPVTVDKSLKWTRSDPLELSDHTIFQWDTSKFDHLPVNQLTSVSNTTVQPALPLTLSFSSTIVLSPKRKITPMKPPTKQKGCTSDLPQISEKKQYITGQDRDSNYYDMHIEPMGCKWHNNSCAYDSIIFVLYNVWRADPDYLTEHYSSLNNEWLGLFTQSFQSYAQHQYSLEEVREFIRRHMNTAFPNLFVFGCNTSVEAIVSKIFTGSDKFNESYYKCSNNHKSTYVASYNCAFAPGGTGRAQWSTIQDYLNISAARALQNACAVCNAPVVKYDTFLYAPVLIVILVSGSTTPADIDLKFFMNGKHVWYDLQGIIYYGQVHFTARYIDAKHQVWFNDGIQTGCTAVCEGNVQAVDLSTGPDTRTPELYIYVRHKI